MERLTVEAVGTEASSSKLTLTMTHAPAAGSIRSRALDKLMPRLRIPVAHCKADAPIIDAFQCSECEWSYLMREPEPYTISYPDAALASRAFDDHRCQDFQTRKKMAAA